MTSNRHNQGKHADDGYLDAARDNILAVGWRRTTLTDVAKRAGVSRMTMYRRWPDMQSLLADLLVREWGGLIDEAVLGAGGSLADGVVRAVAALRDNALFQRIVDVDPELLLPYLLHRRGRNQDHVLELLAEAIRAGQAEGSVRDGDREVMARAVLLAVQGFVISRPTMTDVAVEDLDQELAALVDRYLRP